MHVRDHTKIKQLMDVHNVSNRQLAKGVGYASHTSINRLVAGNITRVNGERARRIARYFNVDVDVLFVSEASTPTRRSVKTKVAS